MGRSTHRLMAAFAVAGLALTACGGGEAAPTTTTVLLQKNSALRKACSALPTKKARDKCRDADTKATKAVNKAAGDVEDAANDFANDVEKSFNETAKKVDKAYKNARNEVVDAANQVIKAFPTKWPDELGLEAVAPMFENVVKQVKNVIPNMSKQFQDTLNKAAKDFDEMDANEAEDAINDILAKPGKVVSSAIPIPGLADLISPYMSPLRVKVKQKEWDKKRAVNLQIHLDFFGLKKYDIGVACLGWPNGLKSAPTFVLNGGCNNPWNLMGNLNYALDIVRDNIKAFQDEMLKVQDQMIAQIKTLAKGANNPRTVPPLAIDLPLNEILGAISSGGVPSLEGIAMSVPIEFTIPGLGKITVSGSDFNWSSQPDDNKDGKKDERDKKKKAAADSKKGSKGAGFSLYPELEVSAAVGDTWTSNGKIQFDVGVGWFGLSLMNVGMSCLTMGTAWEATPSFTFQGGCDNKWDLEGPSQSYVS